MKVDLNRHFSDNDKENGYKIIKTYNTINSNRIQKNHYSGDLIEKYEQNFALWNIIEILNFNDFIEFYNLYFSMYRNEERLNLYYFFKFVKHLRNACAHNNCILNSINKEIEINKRLNTLVSKRPDLIS